MKAISVQDAQGKLGELIAEACGGEIIVLTDGDKKVTLYPGAYLDLEQDSPELEVEILKGVEGPFTPYVAGETMALCEKMIREKLG